MPFVPEYDVREKISFHNKIIKKYFRVALKSYILGMFVCTAIVVYRRFNKASLINYMLNNNTYLYNSSIIFLFNITLIYVQSVSVAQ